MSIIAGTLASILMLLATAATPPSAMSAAATPAAQVTPAAAVLRVRAVNLRNSTG